MVYCFLVGVFSISHKGLMYEISLRQVPASPISEETKTVFLHYHCWTLL